jgi:hypothetical protein
MRFKLVNSIEQVFSKLKHLLRKAKERTIEATGSALVRSSKCSHHKKAQLETALVRQDRQ